MKKWIKVQNNYDLQYEYVNVDHISRVYQDSSNGKKSMTRLLDGKYVPISLIQFLHGTNSRAFICVIGSPDDIMKKICEAEDINISLTEKLTIYSRALKLVEKECGSKAAILCNIFKMEGPDGLYCNDICPFWDDTECVCTRPFDEHEAEDILNEETEGYETPEQISDTLKSKDEPIMSAPKPTKTRAALWAESLGDIELKAAICAGGCSNCPVAHKGAFFCTDLKGIHDYLHREVEV
jgi:hypothetical protein